MSVSITPTIRENQAARQGRAGDHVRPLARRPDARLSLRRNISWLVVGNTVNAASSWGRVVMLAHVGNAAMIGQLVLALAICNPIADFADLGLCGALVSDARREFRFADYLGLRLTTSLLALLAIAGAAWTGGYEPSMPGLLCVTGLLVALESVCDIFHALLQQHERMNYVSISLMIRGPLGLALFAFLTWTTCSLAWGVLGFSLAAVFTLLAIDIPCTVSVLSSDRSPQTLRSLLHFTAAPRVLMRLAWLSLPLGLATAVMSLTTSIPRYAVSYCLGHTALGAFAVAGALTVATSLIVGAVTQAASPRLAKDHAAGNATAFARMLWTLLGSVSAVSLAAVVGLALFGRPLLSLLYGSEFGPFARLATCLMLAAALRNISVALGRAISAARRFRTNLVIRLLGIGVTAALVPPWTMWLGLAGAAGALMLSWLIVDLVALAAVLQIIRRMQSTVSLNSA